MQLFNVFGVLVVVGVILWLANAYKQKETNMNENILKGKTVR